MIFSELQKGDRFRLVSGAMIPAHMRPVYTKVSAGAAKDEDGQWFNVNAGTGIEVLPCDSCGKEHAASAACPSRPPRVAAGGRKLGRAQSAVLRCLHEHRRWYGGQFGCGWNWGTQLQTEKILQALVKRGLALKNIERVGTSNTEVYRVSEAGRAVLDAGPEVRS